MAHPHDENFRIRLTDFSSSSNLKDAFGRLRISSTGQRLDVEFIYDKQKDFFDEITNNGTVTHNANTRDLTLSLSDANDDTRAKMASHPVPYTPGNSQLIEMTGVLDLANIGGGTAEIFLRSSISGSPVDTTISQSEWLTFADSSSLNWNFAHIFTIDFQSLKTGSIKFYISENGVARKVGEITSDNVRDSGYWQLPNLPIYYDLYNSGGNTYMELGYGDANNAVGFRYIISANASATMKAICCTVKSEGGINLTQIPGLSRSIDTAVTPVTVSTSLVPIISIRPAATYKSLPNLGIAIPKTVTVQTDEAIKFVLIHDTVLTGASWTAVNANESMMEYDVSASALSGGHDNLVEYIYATTSGPQSARFSAAKGAGLLGKTVLWDRKHDSVTGHYTLAAIRTGASDASVFAGINWEEIR
jgi:hypothetical protein